MNRRLDFENLLQKNASDSCHPVFFPCDPFYDPKSQVILRMNMISCVSTPVYSLSRIKPRFAGETNGKSVDSAAHRELSQEAARFFPSLSTAVLTGVAALGGAVIYRQNGVITRMNKHMTDMMELNQVLSMFARTRHWVRDKVLVPGALLASATSLGLSIRTWYKMPLVQVI